MTPMKFLRLSCILLLVISPLSANSQTPDKIRDDVEKIGISKKITVIFKTGQENSGAVAEIGTDTFQIVEIDQQQKLTIRYDEVKKVRSNYGGKGFAGKRPDPRWGLIAGAALIGGLITIAALAAGGS
jgi:hypothetical protein